MKILLVNKYHYLKGGSEKYYFDLAELLKEKGHDVAFFSMEDEKNIKTNCKEYFVKKIDLNNASKLKALDVIYSKENYKLMKEAINDFNPDIVHLNNFQRQLSSSIIKAIKEKNIPIVYTAHDAQAICPAITMMDNKLNLCQKCIGGKYCNCIRNKCNKGSFLKSLLGALEGYFYRFNNIYTKKIDSIITPSEFLKEVLIKDGISKEKISVIKNFVEIPKLELKDDGYALFFGRLSKEKGVLNLIKAFSQTEKGKLYIAGDGPEKNNIINFIENNNLENRIKILGYLNKKDMFTVIKNSKFVIISSICYENLPYSVMESLKIGKPVLASKIGGISELVHNGVNGYTYQYDSIYDLKNKIESMFNNDELLKKLSINAYEEANKLYTKNNYYNQLDKIYKKLLRKGI